MTEKMVELREIAFNAKSLYQRGAISREEAEGRFQPYADEYNRIGKEKAKKYNQRFRPLSFSIYVRSSF